MYKGNSKTVTGKQKTLVIAAGIGAGVVMRELLRKKHGHAFRGQVALITGASCGLGLELARELSREGCRLVISGRDEQELAAAGKDLRDHGAEVLAVPCDVRDRRQVSELVRAATREFGGVDILVNNAGAVESGRIEDLQVSDFELAMDLMFWGTVYTTLELLPAFASRRSGRIINICSIGGKVAAPRLLPYTCAQRAVTGFSEGLRAELAPKGIFVTAIAPAPDIGARKAAREIIEAVRENRSDESPSRTSKSSGKTAGLLGAIASVFLPGAPKSKWGKTEAALRMLKGPALALLLEVVRNSGRGLDRQAGQP
jgi:NAD(P)-dependent dehydrogenase (short-subunit alcohol dehydrogenase family)